MPVLCTFENCRKRASYALYFQKPIYCKNHGIENNAKPQYAICNCGTSRPIFGLINTRPNCCKKCKTDNMVDLRNKKCEETNCDKQANFDFAGNEGRGRYCFTHKKSGMISLTKVCCKDCDKTPLFGEYGKEAEYCKKHKKEGMIDLRHIKCKEDGCVTRACFGYNATNIEYCFEHKKENMVNVTYKKCKTEGCLKHPSFGIPGENDTYCLEHKSQNMVALRPKYCIYNNCKTRASFGYSSDKKVLYCSTHKLENMKILSKPLCLFENCQNYGSYSSEEEPNKLYCKTHKTNGMMILSLKRCEFENCKTIPIYGFPNKNIQYCFTHKQEGMIDLHGKMCPECPLNQRGNPKYSNYCTECFVRKFPTDARTFLVRKKSDEITVRDFLYKNFPTLNLTHDKPIWTHNCECINRRRIDLRTLIGNTMIAIEIDERQHKDRDVKDEELRYDDLYMNYSGKWIFIRYNPHIYKSDKGKRVNPQTDKRLNILKQEVEKHINRIKTEQNIELLEIHKLFYDGFKL